MTSALAHIVAPCSVTGAGPRPRSNRVGRHYPRSIVRVRSTSAPEEHVETHAEIDAASWHGLPVFSWLKETGNVDSHEMFRAFNVGIGMIVIVGATRAESIAQILHKNGEKMHIIGQVTENNTAERVKISNGDKLW